MKSIQKLIVLSEKFEAKLRRYAQRPIVSQTGTTELFFGDEGKQRAFNAAIQSGAIAKFLTDYATKTQKTAGFNLQVSATPGKGAGWILTTTPPTLVGTINKLLDGELRRITGKGMIETQKAADTAAKSGAGTGTLPIGSFSADMD